MVSAYELHVYADKWQTVKRIYELFQRCRSRVRTAAAIDVIRFGLHRDLRKMRQDFSRATPRSTGARAADSARLAVCWVGVSSRPGGRLRSVGRFRGLRTASGT